MIHSEASIIYILRQSKLFYNSYGNIKHIVIFNLYNETHKMHKIY